MEVSRELALLAARAAEERKATGVVVLDLKGLTLVADYFLIASGESRRQVKAIAEHVEETMVRAGVKLLHRKGVESGRWILLDFGGLVCHIFSRADREFYALERFWGDAPRLWPEETVAAAADRDADVKAARPRTYRRRGRGPGRRAGEETSSGAEPPSSAEPS
ncbi:MAG: ribosome silencing factor [Firmicutes bacterium]|nr:ribosome silencing factor [Bacillota bacterium]